MRGKIDRLMRTKGFGFIKGNDGGEYFFHASAIRNSAFDELQEQQDVEFEPEDSAKGPRAEQIFVD